MALKVVFLALFGKIDKEKNLKFKKMKKKYKYWKKVYQDVEKMKEIFEKGGLRVGKIREKSQKIKYWIKWRKIDNYFKKLNIIRKKWKKKWNRIGKRKNVEQVWNKHYVTACILLGYIYVILRAFSTFNLSPNLVFLYRVRFSSDNVQNLISQFNFFFFCHKLVHTSILSCTKW